MVYSDFKTIVVEQITQFYKEEYKALYDQILSCNSFEEFFKLLYSDYKKLMSILFTPVFLLKIPAQIRHENNVFIREQNISDPKKNLILIECNIDILYLGYDFTKIIIDDSQIRNIIFANEAKVYNFLITGNSWIRLLLSDLTIFNFVIDFSSYVSLHLQGHAWIHKLIMTRHSIATINCTHNAIIHELKMFGNSTISEMTISEDESYKSKIISLEVNENAFVRVKEGKPKYSTFNGGLVMQPHGNTFPQQIEEAFRKLSEMNVYGVMFALAEAKTGNGSYQDYLPEESWKPLKPVLEKFISDLDNTTQTVF